MRARSNLTDIPDNSTTEDILVFVFTSANKVSILASVIFGGILELW